MFNWLKSKVASSAAVLPTPAATTSLDRAHELRLEGNAWLDKGNIAAAAASYQQAVAHDPRSVDARISLGFALSELARFDEAEPQLLEAIRLHPTSHDALYLLGTVHQAQRQSAAAIDAWRRTVALKPDFDLCRRSLILALVQSGDLTAAELAAADGMIASPANADFPYLLGNIHASRGDLERAVESYTKALSISPDYAQVHQGLGEALKKQGNLVDAIESHRRSVALNPADADARARLAAALHDHGQLDAAAATYRQVLALDAKHAETYVNMGYALQQLGQMPAAIESYEKAIALRPDYAGAHINLGDALMEIAQLEQAVASYRQALALQPRDDRAHNNLAGALLSQGRLDDALAGYEKALQLAPNYIAAYSNRLFALNYHPDKSAEEIFEAYREFDRRFSIPPIDGLKTRANSRSTQRLLKVGYLSPDFKKHAVRHFLAPLFDHHDKKVVELHAYSDVLVEDGVTAGYKARADRWIPICGMSDEAVADRIRADRIDILVDLAGHTGRNRLGIFARKPAPIAVSWLGFGYTTGLSAIDYFLTDGTAAPFGFDHLFAERPWRMPTPSYVYRPTPGMGDVGPSPATRRGFVTFGTLTRAIRVNHRVVRAWAEILRRVEGSRLVVDSVNYEDASARNALVAAFAVHRIASERLDIGFHTPPWDTLRGIDIGLDCFPHNSGTTLFETLYMGVPYVTLAGRPSVGRLGSTILAGAGHPEWIAHSEEEYIDMAVALAADLPRLAAIRAGLRAEMQASALMDEPGFARKVEAAYREMFALWATKP